VLDDIGVLGGREAGKLEGWEAGRLEGREAGMLDTEGCTAQGARRKVFGKW